MPALSQRTSSPIRGINATFTRRVPPYDPQKIHWQKGHIDIKQLTEDRSSAYCVNGHSASCLQWIVRPKCRSCHTSQVLQEWHKRSSSFDKTYFKILHKRTVKYCTNVKTCIKYWHNCHSGLWEDWAKLEQETAHTKPRAGLTSVNCLHPKSATIPPPFKNDVLPRTSTTRQLYVLLLQEHKKNNTLIHQE